MLEYFRIRLCQAEGRRERETVKVFRPCSVLPQMLHHVVVHVGENSSFQSSRSQFSSPPQYWLIQAAPHRDVCPAKFGDLRGAQLKASRLRDSGPILVSAQRSAIVFQAKGAVE